MSQENKPIALASKALGPTESPYANIEREFLAVVYSCEKFHTYLYGRKFVVESDHRLLEQIHKESRHGPYVVLLNINQVVDGDSRYAVKTVPKR